jgi:hypothetical protein
MIAGELGEGVDVRIPARVYVPHRPFDVETFVADHEALRRHWAHERWTSAATPGGAALALFYDALEHPDRTLGVIYVGGDRLARRFGSPRLVRTVEGRVQVRQGYPNAYGDETERCRTRFGDRLIYVLTREADLTNWRST